VQSYEKKRKVKMKSEKIFAFRCFLFFSPTSFGTKWVFAR